MWLFEGSYNSSYFIRKLQTPEIFSSFDNPFFIRRLEWPLVLSPNINSEIVGENVTPAVPSSAAPVFIVRLYLFPYRVNMRLKSLYFLKSLQKFPGSTVA